MTAYAAQDLDERNVGQVLIEVDDDTGMEIFDQIQSIERTTFTTDSSAGVVTVSTSNNIFTYNFGDTVETRMSPELRMLRLMMNRIIKLDPEVEQYTTEEALAL